MTLVSALDLLEPREYMESLDYWTEFSIECHFRRLVDECKAANATGTTETEETEETEETGKSDDLPPFTEIYNGQ